MHRSGRIDRQVRVVFASEMEDELWERWARGESSRLIARRLRITPHAVRAVLARHGGVRPRTRARGKQQLTAAEREDISGTSRSAT